jgi:hypothetical protein
MKKIWTDFDAFFVVLMIAIPIIIILVTQSNKNTPPVEEHSIDSLIELRDSLTKEINCLDSIKNEKIIEIYNLDNDSTVKLFYKLVSNK